MAAKECRGPLQAGRTVGRCPARCNWARVQKEFRSFTGNATASRRRSPPRSTRRSAFSRRGP
eukprot:10296041-Lingulodinium_polyedra.AAC.1